MAEFDAELRPWGNSQGILVPKDILAKARLKPHTKVHVIVITNTNVLKRTFGMLKGWNIDTQKLKDELREELYDD